MHDTFNLLTVQNELGYVFKDPDIIKAAFTHRSYEAKNTENNIRLAFLGKELISFVLCDYITSRLPYTNEKQLAYQKQSYASALGIESFIKKHSLARFVMLGQLNEPMRNGAPLATELFYAVCAAIFRDGGLPALKSFLMPMIRACGGDDHYQPSVTGQVLVPTDQSSDNEQHIKSQRLRKPAKSGSIGMSKADTVNIAKPEAAPKPESKKEERGLAKLLNRKKKTKEVPVVPEEPKEATPSVPTERKFIRDPFAPVKLSDDLRNFKPKKPSKYDTSPKNSDTAPTQSPSTVTEKKPISESPVADDKNYKSMLQEFVQKNLRTANVLIKYTSAPSGKNSWEAQITIDGKTVATANAQNKKDAEKSAAKTALSLLADKSTAQSKWFTSLSGAEISPPENGKDHISQLNQYMQKKLRASYAPIVYERTKAKDRKGFTVSAVCNGEVIGSATASDPKEAKRLAAKDACEKLGI